MVRKEIWGTKTVKRINPRDKQLLFLRQIESKNICFFNNIKYWLSDKKFYWSVICKKNNTIICEIKKY